MRQVWFFIIFSIILIALIIWNPQSGRNLRNSLEGASTSGDSVASEIAALKSQVAVLQGLQAEIPSAPQDAINAFVYSKYPYDIKNELLINAGGSDGVRVGDGVFSNNMFIGKISNVYDHSALVETLFDERWHSSVRIGGKGIDALLTGGNEPRMSLINKNANVSKGDPVYNAMPGFSYGAAIAELDSVNFTSDHLFQEASLVFPYNINDIHAVFVIHAR